MNIPGMWSRYLRDFFREADDPSIGRRIKFAVAFTLIGSLAQLGFSLLRLWQGRWMFAAADIILAAYLLTTLNLMRRSGRPAFYIPIGLTGLFFFLMFLFATGGANGLGLSWLYFFPVTAFFLCGRRGGVKWMGIMFLSMFGLYLLQYLRLISPYYPFTMGLQVIASLLVEAAMVYYYASITERDEEQIGRHNQNLEQANRALEKEMVHRRQAEQELLRIRQAVNSLGDAVVIADPAGRHIFHNPAFSRMFGYSLEEINQAGGTGFLFREPRTGLRLIESLRKGQGFSGEVEMQNKEGRLLTIVLRADAIKGSEGGMVGLVAVHADITRQKQAERALKQSEERFRQVIGSISAHIYVTRFGTEGTPENDYISPNVTALTGYPLQMFVEDWNFWAENLILPQDREAARQQADKFKQALNSELEYRITKKDGSVIWVRDSGRAERNKQTGEITVYGVISNITERKLAEAAIQESEIKHRLLLDSISLPVLALKEDMTILYCNQAYARFVNLGLDQLEGKNLLQLFPRLEKTKTYQMYQKALRTGLSQESEGKHRDRFIHSDIYRTPWGILAIAEDITERKQGEDALWHAKEDLEQRVEERTRELAEANRLLKQSYDDTIRAITAAMDAKDSYTRGHSEEVKRIALVIGQKISLPPGSLRLLEYAALLHDIGKIGVSEQLLTKGTALTEFEFEEVKLHPQIGGKLLEQVELLKEAGPIIHAHHENYDGSGYPKGLKGESIPIESRIIAVADAYEAMTVDRPYRKAFSKSEAQQRLRQGAGTQFDPRIVEILLEVE
ncbi:PAS domain S-box protein [candidate division TA06 bacterium]|nr:PAS domain S-box protein [candidate division TA06 bacterium]